MTRQRTVGPGILHAAPNEPHDAAGTGVALARRPLPNPLPRHQVVLMKIGVARETAPGERRVALVPEALGKLAAAGLEILVEAGAGVGALIPDSAFTEAGATVVSTRRAVQARPT